MLVPAASALAGLVVLLGLGTWQIERKVWKEALIATLTQRLNAAPVELPPPDAWTRLTPENSEFRRVRLEGEFLNEPQVYVYTSGSALRPDIKSPGYFVFAPARLPSGAIVAVNAGYVADFHRYAWTGGKVEIVGYMRWPEAPSWFVSEHDTSEAIWFVRDHRSMARLKHWGDWIAPFYIDLESPVPAAGGPRPGPLMVNLRNDHLQYAITWYSLAVVLVIVFVAWTVKRRREGQG